jgi:hypothetical protein
MGLLFSTAIATAPHCKFFRLYRMKDMMAENFFVGEMRPLEKLCLSISPSWPLEGQVLLPAYVKPSNASAISEDEHFYLSAISEDENS